MTFIGLVFASRMKLRSAFFRTGGCVLCKKKHLSGVKGLLAQDKSLPGRGRSGGIHMLLQRTTNLITDCIIPWLSFACLTMFSCSLMYHDACFSTVFFSQLMTVQTVVVFHLIAAVKIIIFARARVVTLENVNLIVQVYKCFTTCLTNSPYGSNDILWLFLVIFITLLDYYKIA